MLGDVLLLTGYAAQAVAVCKLGLQVARAESSDPFPIYGLAIVATLANLLTFQAFLADTPIRDAWFLLLVLAGLTHIIGWILSITAPVIQGRLLWGMAAAGLASIWVVAFGIV